MIAAFFVGRIVVGIYFLINAWGHLAHSSDMAGYAASKGVPAPRLAVVGSGLLLLVGGLSIVTGVYTFWGVVALLVFMIPVTFTMHSYWKESDPMARMEQKISFQKNLALAGCLLMILSVSNPWPYSLLF
jgi:uncharacterized membrane protein YphA (DoxX/SURF4 family)